MGKFGKKNVVKDDILSYNIGIIGESGIGKSTLMKKVCEQVAGDDGYIALNIGKEDGHDAIDGIITENAPTWKRFIEIVDDIVANKKIDYPNLRVAIIDTIDQLFEIVEPEVIRMHNLDVAGKKDGKRASSINAAFGGFGAGQDKAIELVLTALWRLKQVGVSFIVIGHTKKRDIEDPVTGETYSTLTTNMVQRYFNAIKTKLHVLGVASVDREIIKEKTGKKNIVTKEEIIKGKIISESRKITFRDDNYTIDSKSRFACIADSIPLDANAFIKAMRDAIAKAKNDGGVGAVKGDEKAGIISNDAPPQHANAVSNDTVPPIENEKAHEEDIQQIMNTIRSKFKTAAREQKDYVKNELLNGGKLDESLPIGTLNKILAYLN